TTCGSWSGHGSTSPRTSRLQPSRPSTRAPASTRSMPTCPGCRSSSSRRSPRGFRPRGSRQLELIEKRPHALDLLLGGRGVGRARIAAGETAQVERSLQHALRAGEPGAEVGLVGEVEERLVAPAQLPRPVEVPRPDRLVEARMLAPEDRARADRAVASMLVN